MWDFIVFLVDTAMIISSTLSAKLTLSDLALNSLTAIDAREHQLFDKLLW